MLMEPDTDKKDMEERNTSFRDVIAEFMGYTSAHGFGRLVAATSFAGRIFWILGILGGFVMFCSETMSLFKLYLSRPVQTSVSVTFDKQLIFPAVTICNLNKIKKSSVKYLPDELQKMFSDSYEDLDTTSKRKRRRKRGEPTKSMENVTNAASSLYNGSTDTPLTDEDVNDDCTVMGIC